MSLAENIHGLLWADADKLFYRHYYGTHHDHLFLHGPDDPPSDYDCLNGDLTHHIRLLAMRQAMWQCWLPVNDAYAELYANVCTSPAEWLAGELDTAPVIWPLG